MKLGTSWRQSGLMVTGTILNSILGLLFYLILTRGLEISDFGYFSYLLGLGLLAAEFGDLGIGSAIIRFGSSDNFSGIYTLALLERLVISVIIFIIFLIPSLAFDRFLIYSAAVAISLLFSFVATQSLIARQQYLWQVLANISGNIVRLILILYLLTLGLLTPLSAIVAFCLGAAATFLLASFPVLKEIGFSYFSFAQVKTIFRNIYLYRRNLAISFSLASLASKLDIPLLFGLAGPIPAGIYSSAQKLSSIFPQIAVAVEGVFSPKFSQSNMSKYFRDYILTVIIISLGLLLLIPLSPIMIPLILGAKFAAAASVFSLLSIGLIPFFLTGPFVASILYRLGKSGYHLLVSLISLIVTIVMYFLLIPKFGALGTAISVAGANFLSFLLYFVIWRKLSTSR